MTGTVTSIEAPGSFCHITDSTGQVYFAHQSDFLEPTLMVVGMEVRGHIKLVRKGKYPAVTDVVAIQRKAA
jgi:hypothetical protein